jgi:cytidine deaminase
MARTSSKAAAYKKVTKELLKSVKHTLKSAYAPYSNISVAAALYCASGRIYSGCNIENSSYSLTMCAERVALFNAISQGEKKFLLLLVHSPQVEAILPCGACLQVYSELAPDIVIVTMNDKNEFHFHPLKTLLAQPFKLPT